VLDVATGRISRPTWQPVEQAVWSPRGEQIAYLARNSYSDEDIYVTSADGRTRARLTRGGYDSDITWSPDARWIAFVASGGNPEILIASPTGSTRAGSRTTSWRIGTPCG